MRTTLDEAYIHLNADAASLYRRLGMCPLERVDQPALAALLGWPHEDTYDAALTLAYHAEAVAT